MEDAKQKRGRKFGQKITTKQEDKQILATFKRMRPPGQYVDSRIVHRALPKPVKKKISRRTVIRRLADKAFLPTRKKSKSDPDERIKKKRLVFARKHADKNFQQWQAYWQAVADLKDRLCQAMVKQNC